MKHTAYSSRVQDEFANSREGHYPSVQIQFLPHNN